MRRLLTFVLALSISGVTGAQSITSGSATMSGSATFGGNSAGAGAFVQSNAANNFSGSATSISVTPSNNVTSGNSLVVSAWWKSASATISSVCDGTGSGGCTGGDTFTVEGSPAVDSTNGWSQQFACAPITATGGTKPAIDTTFSAGQDVLVIFEETTAPCSKIDVHNTTLVAASFGTSVSGQAMVTNFADYVPCFYVDVVTANGETVTPGAGWNLEYGGTSSNFSSTLIDKTQATAGSTTCTATASTGSEPYLQQISFHP